jgi:glyoxylase-like metal-dependent hydrolase (beta-lactamase superfamily II)
MTDIKRFIVGELQTNCYLLISQKEGLIIDPGAEGDRLLREIEKSKTSLKYIINTHYHFDHIGANEIIKNQTSAKILIHKQEKGFVDFSVDRFLQENDEIKIGIFTLKVIHTPGHSQGSICLLAENFIFTGDTLFECGYGRTDLNGGSFRHIQQSLQKLALFLKKGMKVYPGHGSPWIINK